MKVSYKKLWKLLIDRELNKKDLSKLANISSTTITKISKNENITTDILIKICEALNCGIDEIMEIK